MREKQLNGYLVPRADEFQGEFVAPYAERLKALTGFTGSAGLALVLEDKAFFLTDGRYTLQAEGQVDTKAFKVGDYIKTPIGEWIADHAKEGAVIGYDPWLFTPAQIEKISNKVRTANITLKPVEENLVDAVWDNRPARPQSQVTFFPDNIAGHSAKQKRDLIASTLKENGLRAAFLGLPDSVSWLLNVRGADINYIPSVLCYAIIDDDANVTWIIDPAKVDAAIREHLGEQVSILPPEGLQDYIKKLSGPVGMDFVSIPAQIKQLFDNAGIETQNFKDPTIRPKSIKSAPEQESIRRTHIADGVALVKFLHWLDEHAAGQTEISVSDQLHMFRKEDKNFQSDSFPTISGFGANGAVIHYRADKKTDTALEEGNLLLVDSGGQYAGDFFGTTDITRTIAIGEPSRAMCENFTRVLKGHIALASAQFPKGTLGAQIDTLARKPLWDAGLDYAHGTGHGVGCYLAVHEEAANISSRGQTPFEPGMLISNEPGYYEQGAYGIRIENLVLVIEAEDGMLKFETVSLAPIDHTLIVLDMLDDKEKAWLNAYHEMVLKTLSPHLEDEQDKAWLQSACKKL